MTIIGEGLQNLGLCSSNVTFERLRIYIVSHTLWHGASVFLVSTEVTLYNKQNVTEDIDPHEAEFAGKERIQSHDITVITSSYILKLLVELDDQIYASLALWVI